MPAMHTTIPDDIQGHLHKDPYAVLREVQHGDLRLERVYAAALASLLLRTQLETKISTRELAERSGLSVAALNDFMTGRTRRPLMATLRKVDTVLRELLADRL